MSQQFLIMDFETRSEAILRTKGKQKIGVGAWEYAVHPTTHVLCVAWKQGTKETLKSAKTHVWKSHASDKALLARLISQLRKPDIQLVAHNAGFEQVITQHVLPKHLTEKLPPIPIDRWHCTAAMSATHALPRDLEGACQVLNLAHQKNPRGKLLIQRHCQPRRPSKNNPSRWNDDPEGLDELAKYCADDVEAETELFLKLPMLIPHEREVWKLNQRINLRGVYVDRKLVNSALAMLEQEMIELEARGLHLTGGIRPTQRAQIQNLLSDLGCTLPNMQAKTIDDALATGFATGRAREILITRQALSKTSTTKYMAFFCRSQSDSRARDIQLYHGASTGREAGTGGTQVHNLPRPTISDVDDAIAAILDGDRDWVRAIHGNVMAALSSCLRGCITATPGHQIYNADFNAIEARVLFWVAKHDAGLRIFATGEDPYRAMAAKIYRKSLEKVTDAEREVGKRAILGLGYNMGAPKFEQTCKQFGMPVTTELAELAVDVYRSEHALVPKLWRNLEMAAISATQNPGKKYFINRTIWYVKNNFLYCQLPSGRSLAYFKPSVRQEEKWGRKRATLYHYGVEHHQWVNRGTYGGKLCENVIQAVARDLMVAAQLRTEKAGYIPMMSVHDELLAERKIGEGSLEEFEKLMAELPLWAIGLPVKVKGWRGPRYKK